MRVDELLGTVRPKVLLEGKHLEIYEALLPVLRIKEDQPNIFRPGGGMNANYWFKELNNSLRNLAIASNIQKRLKEIGVTGTGADRVSAAVTSSAETTRFLLSNPGATAYKIPVWTTKNTMPKPMIKRWNEAFERAFQEKLSKIDLNE